MEYQFASPIKKGNSVTIKFIKQNQTSPENVNKVIECIPPSYKSGHTQMVMLQAMLPNKSYTIDFRDNRDVAEKFARELFDKCGNIFQIQRNWM